jgi:hypothetical protein
MATWIIAAGVGIYLLRTWIANGGLRKEQGNRSSRFPPALILSHGGLAAAGLVIWIVYVYGGSDVLAWTVLFGLIPVAVLGSTMFGLWLLAGHKQPRGHHAYQPRHAAEDTFPPPAVLGHGLFAVVTVVLVLLTTLRM